MTLRALLVALIVAATGTFVVGVALERSAGESRHASHAEARQQSHSEAGESAEHRRAETVGESSGGEPGDELRPLGIDVEAWPFVALAALASLAMAAAAWLRREAIAVLLAISAAMLVFAALDVREIFHQVDENRDGLATLAAAAATLHGGAGAIAIAIAQRARGAPRRATGTLPA